MQWNCPHCGIKLIIADDSVHAGWSFSKCATCAGFALVRRVEMNVIKVDKAPPGENVLLPDALSVGGVQGLMGEVATRNLARRIPPGTPPPALNTSPHGGARGANGSVNASALASSQSGGQRFPEPLPELMVNPKNAGASARGSHGPPTTATLRKLPLGILVATLTSVASGAYFYVQAQALWHRAREQAAATHSAPTAVVTDQIQDTATAPIKPL